MLLFASQSCGPCTQMLPEVVRWSETLSERLTFVLIESGVEDPAGLAGDIAGLGSLLTLVDDQHEVAQLYGVTMTPSGLIVDAEGRILTNQSSGGGNIEGMVRSALNSDPADVVSS